MPNVSTFAEFVNALTSINTGDVINVTADLDFNTWIPSDTTTFPLSCPSDGHAVENVVINGNGHTIYNIDNSRASAGYQYGLFRFFPLTGSAGNGAIRINNLNFLNCAFYDTNKYIFTTSVQTTTSYKSIIFDGCTIQGTFKDWFTAGNFHFERCMITIRSSTGTFTTGSGSYNPYLYQCWIYLNDVYKTLSGRVFNILDSCYVKGNIRFAASTTVSFFNLFSRCANSCINVTADLTGTGAVLSNVISPSSSTTDLNVVNTDKLTGTGASTSSTVVAVTDEQMRNADYLFNLGFDIIPN